MGKYIKHLESLGFKILEKVEENKVISKVIKTEELDKKIVLKIKEGNIQQAYEEIDKWYLYIKQRLEKEALEGIDIFEKYEIIVSNEIKEKMQFIKNGYIDLSFENIFCEEEYLFYDQEWYFENVPIQFILYRAINNLYNYNSSKLEQKLKKEEIFKKFDLICFIPYFEELERKIQEEILDKQLVNEYRDTISKYTINIEELNKDNIEITKQFLTLKEKNESLIKEKEEIEKKYNLLLNEYNTSRGWKVIKGFRKFLGKE